MNKVIIDTNVWSQVLRRRGEFHSTIKEELYELLEMNRAVILGPIRQELLTGFREKHQFEKLKQELRSFQDLFIKSEEYELAAGLHTICTQNGVQCCSVDILICAFSINNNMQIFTLDKDFLHYQKHIPIKLYDTKA